MTIQKKLEIMRINAPSCFVNGASLREKQRSNIDLKKQLLELHIDSDRFKKLAAMYTVNLLIIEVLTV